MFAREIRPTEVSLVLYIVKEIARDADFRAANAEKLMELAESRLARYSPHDPGNQAKVWSAWPPERNGCSTACSKRKGVLYRTSLRGTAGGGEGPYENDTKTINRYVACRRDA